MTYIRSGLRERASTSGTLAFLYVLAREIVGRLKKKKGSLVTGLLCTLKFPRSSAARWCPVYIVSREKEKSRACVHRKFLDADIEFCTIISRDYGVEARDRYPSELFLRHTFNLFSYAKDGWSTDTTVEHFLSITVCLATVFICASLVSIIFRRCILLVFQELRSRRTG